MVEQGRLSLALATSNARKLDQFRKQAPSLDAIAVPVQFDEERIKGEIGIPESEGFQYVAQISRAKFDEQRKRMRREVSSDDYSIVVSDSVVMIKENGGYTAVNRDGLTQERKDEVLQAINESGVVRYVGSVTFGRKNGESGFTVLSYLDVPLDKPVETFPIEVSTLPDIVDKKKGYTAGFVRFDTTKKGEYIPHFVSTVEDEFDFQRVRPHISGLTSETLHLADTVGKIDLETASLLENLIEQRPFNTLSFYAEYARRGKGDVYAFYRSVVEERKEFYEMFGGNCSLHTLRLMDELKKKGFDPRVVVFSSNNPSHKKGHSGVLVEQNGVHFLFDPGMTVPFVVPISGSVPLFPIRVGDKEVLSTIWDTDADGIPDLYIYKAKGGKIIRLPGQEIITSEEFESELPTILADLHSVRTLGKLDFHDKKGKKIFGIAVDFNKASVEIRIGEDMIKHYSLNQILESGSKEQGELTLLCREHTINPEIILQLLYEASN